jgi:hypothetical protein
MYKKPRRNAITSAIEIEREGMWMEVEIEGTYLPGEPMTRDYPGSGPDIEDIKATSDGVEIELTDEETEEAWERLMEKSEDADPDAGWEDMRGDDF